MTTDTLRNAVYQRSHLLPGVELVSANDVRHVMPRQSVPHDKLVLIERGQRLFYHRGREHQAGAGDLIIIPAGEVCGSRPAESAAEVRIVCIEPEKASAWLGSRSWSLGAAGFCFSNSPAAAVLSQIFRVTTPHDDLQRHSLLLELITKFCENHTNHLLPLVGSEPVAGSEPGPIRRARACLEERYHENLSLNDLAATAGLDPAYLCRAFRRTVGVSPHAYLVGIRVAHAKSLLADGLPPGEVAAATGFYDQAHLTRLFARYVRTTPAQYARSVRCSSPPT